MRRLSPEQVDLITAATNESLSDFAPGALEKDIHLTEVLRALTNVNQQDFTLVFCGGTSLVKAYGYINRMSEDIDIKVVLKSNPTTSELRRKMSSLKEEIRNVFMDADFAVQNVSAENQNRFITFELQYTPMFPTEVSLRPEVRVELIHGSSHLPTRSLSISTLLYRDLEKFEDKLDFECNSIEETIAEKILSFLRRSLLDSSTGKRDERLVRHIYDVHELAARQPNPALVEDAFQKAVEEDAIKFANQNQEFTLNPKSYLRSALEKVSADSELSNSYSKFVTNLVAGSAPLFKTAFSTFDKVANDLISSLN
jgi:predicted nucleotidyltransferase component of viral defense system